MVCLVRLRKGHETGGGMKSDRHLLVWCTGSPPSQFLTKTPALPARILASLVPCQPGFSLTWCVASLNASQPGASPAWMGCLAPFSSCGGGLVVAAPNEKGLDARLAARAGSASSVSPLEGHIVDKNPFRPGLDHNTPFFSTRKEGLWSTKGLPWTTPLHGLWFQQPHAPSHAPPRGALEWHTTGLPGSLPVAYQRMPGACCVAYHRSAILQPAPHPPPLPYPLWSATERRTTGCQGPVCGVPQAARGLCEAYHRQLESPQAGLLVMATAQ